MNFPAFFNFVALFIFKIAIVQGSRRILDLDTKANLNPDLGHTNCSYAENLSDFGSESEIIDSDGFSKISSGFWKPEGNFSCFISYNLSGFQEKISYFVQIEGIEREDGEIGVSVILFNESVHLTSSVQRTEGDWISKWFNLTGLISSKNCILVIQLDQPNKKDLSILDSLTLETWTRKLSILPVDSANEIKNSGETGTQERIQNASIIFGNTGKTEFIVSSQHVNIVDNSVSFRQIGEGKNRTVTPINKLSEDESSATEESTNTEAPSDSESSSGSNDDSEATTSGSHGNEESTTTSEQDDSSPAETTEESSDTSGATEESSDTSGATEKPSDTSGATEKPSDTSGATEEPSDTSGATEESSDTSGATEEPSDTSGGTEKPSDTSGATEEPSDTSGATEESPDTSGATEESPDTSGATEESSDTSGVTETSSDTSGATEESSSSSDTTEKSSESSGATENPSSSDSTPTVGDRVESTTTTADDSTTKASELPDKAAQGSQDTKDDSRNRIGLYVGLISIMILVIGIAIAIVIYRMKKLRQITMVSEF